MSIVAGTHRVNTCANVIGSVSSLTMDPPTPMQYGTPYNATGSGVAATVAAWGGTAADGTTLEGA